MSGATVKLKEYRQIVKYACGHTHTIATLDYKPKVDARLVCPACYRRYLLGEITISPDTARLHIEQQTHILMAWR